MIKLDDDYQKWKLKNAKSEYKYKDGKVQVDDIS